MGIILLDGLRLMRTLVLCVLLIFGFSLQAWAAEHGVILAYHHVATDTPPSTTISPTDFQGHLQYLRDNQFNVIGLDTLIEGLQAGDELPDRAVAITFDDGYISIYDEAFPMLQEFGYPFTLFVSTGPINRGQANFMSWDQIREMSEAGVVIANHMIEHPYMLERTEGEDEAGHMRRLRVELLGAEQTIFEETGQAHRYLAYPYGEYDLAIMDLLGELDFVGLAQNSGAVGVHSDFLALPRYPLASIYANLASASSKFETLAFDVTRVDPQSVVTQSRSPRVTLRFEPGNYLMSQIACFANSEPIPMDWLDEANGVVELIPDVEYSGRRWRYICTAPERGSRRYFWYSVQWINTGS